LIVFLEVEIKTRGDAQNVIGVSSLSIQQVGTEFFAQVNLQNEKRKMFKMAIY